MQPYSWDLPISFLQFSSNHQAFYFLDLDSMISLAFLLLLSLAFMCLKAENGSQCFPGLHHCRFSTSRCCCGQDDTFGGRVKCFPDLDGSHSAPAANLVCITYDYLERSHNNGIIAGYCPFIKGANKSTAQIILRQHLSQQKLTEMMCGGMKREGTLCSKCDSMSYLAGNTYDLKCIPNKRCTSPTWLLYLITQFGPLTVFYLIVFLFRINAAAPYISMFILLAQVFSTRLNIIRIVGFATENRKWNILLLSLYSMWNLDVFRIYMPPLCMHRHALEAIALDYLVALYPLILVLITYGLAELHARRWWCVFWFFWPLVKMFKFLHINIDPMRSIMNTFATFILLSITKFTVVSIDLVTYTNIVDVNGTVVRRVPLFDGDTEYFGGRHLPYAILAIVVLFLFNLIPLLLLLLSPLKCFQQCLRCCCCSFRCVHFINAFLEVFQGHFKDGVSHRRDYRFVAGLQFLLRLTFLGVFNSLLSIAFIHACCTVIVILWTVGGLILRPYRREMHNLLEAISGTYIAFIFLLNTYYFYTTKLHPSSQNISLSYVLYFINVTPGLLFLLYSIVHILRLCGCHSRLRQNLQCLISPACGGSPSLQRSDCHVSIENNFVRSFPPLA